MGFAIQIDRHGWGDEGLAAGIDLIKQAEKRVTGKFSGKTPRTPDPHSRAPATLT